MYFQMYLSHNFRPLRQLLSCHAKNSLGPILDFCLQLTYSEHPVCCTPCLFLSFFFFNSNLSFWENICSGCFLKMRCKVGNIFETFLSLWKFLSSVLLIVCQVSELLGWNYFSQNFDGFVSFKLPVLENSDVIYIQISFYVICFTLFFFNNFRTLLILSILKFHWNVHFADRFNFFVSRFQWVISFNFGNIFEFFYW